MNKYEGEESSANKDGCFQREIGVIYHLASSISNVLMSCARERHV